MGYKNNLFNSQESEKVIGIMSHDNEL